MNINNSKYHINGEFSDLHFSVEVVIKTCALATHYLQEQAEEISILNWHQNLSDDLKCTICDMKYKDLSRTTHMTPKTHPVSGYKTQKSTKNYVLNILLPRLANIDPQNHGKCPTEPDPPTQYHVQSPKNCPIQRNNDT